MFFVARAPLSTLLGVLLLVALLSPARAGSPALQTRLTRLRRCLPPAFPLSTRSAPSFARLLAPRNFLSASRPTPAAVALARSEAHVAAAVRCARAAGLRVCARAGGHGYVGESLCAGLLVDVGLLREVTLIGTSGVARVGPGATLGETMWRLHGRRRWLPVGVCPGVGVGGFTLGGGHGPYSGRLGLMCDRMTSARVVDRFGKVIVTSHTRRASLFWGLCGGGGGQFGIVTRFSFRTAPVGIYDRAVVFRFRWPRPVAARVMHLWSRYGEDAGKVWFRMEIFLENSAEPGLYSYGACFDVGSAAACKKRLEKAAFFRVKGRETVFIRKTRDAREAHSFYSDDGRWGRQVPGNVRAALLSKRYADAGEGNARVHQSSFLARRRGATVMNEAFWRRYVAACANPPRQLPWVVCELNRWGSNALGRERAGGSAFAHRRASVVSLYIIGGGEEGAKKAAYWRMRRVVDPLTSGVYVNYGEPGLGKSYPRKYWGKNLARLRKLKKTYDPTGFFAHPESIPM